MNAIRRFCDGGFNGRESVRNRRFFAGCKENDGMMKGMMGANVLILFSICFPFTEKRRKKSLIKSVATLTYSVFICNYASSLVLLIS